MVNFVYTPAKKFIIDGAWDFSTTGTDIRVALLSTNTTAGTEEDAATIDSPGFTVVDEFNGSGYSAEGQALVSEATNVDTANDRAEFTATNITWSSVSAGTRDVQAALLFKFDTSFILSVPVAYIDTGGFPFTPGGGDIVIQWNAEGVLQIT
jgi:hypothetical protein